MKADAGCLRRDNPFEIVPGKGVHPIRFGMSRQDVRTALGVDPYWVREEKTGDTMREEHYDSFLGIHYGPKGSVYSVVVAPGAITVIFGASQVIGPHAIENPFVLFLEADPSPFEDLGFVVFDKIGVALTGYHDGDSEQRAITVYEPNTWPAYRAVPISSDQLI